MLSRREAPTCPSPQVRNSATPQVRKSQSAQCANGLCLARLAQRQLLQFGRLFSAGASPNHHPAAKTTATIIYMTQQQRDYYAQTAPAYDSMHVQPGDEHFVALEYVAGLLQVIRAESVLDVGSGTGRAIRFLQQRCPGLHVEGVEPSGELREQAHLPDSVLHDASGENLPFHDHSFDLVMSFALLHHVPDPAPVVAEMMRVARYGVMISDANRFGQGSIAAGALKLAIARTGLWPAFEFFRTRGRGYLESDGDGIFYSYSIFDSVPQLRPWADRVFVIPTKPQKRIPIAHIAVPHGLLVAVREPAGPGWAGS